MDNDNQPTEPPPHMNPMTTDEVRELLSVTMYGPLPVVTMHRVFATLAAWAPIVDGVTRRVTTSPDGQDAIDSVKEQFDACATRFELAAAMATVRQHPYFGHVDLTTVCKLYTQTCIDNGWEPS